jgi:hypothetical protein
MLLSVGFGQLSPGDLSNVHAEYEGLTNCTLCHDLGNKVTNKKCLDCHDEIQSLINDDRGYHADATVKNKDCFECHNDHHGRKFEMIRFDEQNFNHNQAGYTLEGQHEVIDCRDCHTPDNIEDNKIKKRSDTYLGLNQDCLACHNDFHQETLSDDCTSCHGFEAFRPAPEFDHNETEFILKEKHLDVDCKECHEITDKNGKEFQMFADVSFDDCKSCHNDPHDQHLNGKCMQCHSEQSFSAFIGKGRFNHTSTGFDLLGKHKEIDCFACHEQTADPLTVFQDKTLTEEKNCVTCHDDKHDGKLGNDCAGCHNENSFLELALGEMTLFNHSVTDFPLEGKHSGVDCNKCHTNEQRYTIDFSSCNNCHDDYHNGEFIKEGISLDCDACHSVEEGFDYSLYSIEQHQSSDFPLKGAHEATPCFACHLEEERWKFSNLGDNCIDCHDDLHTGFIDRKFYNENRCESCHSEGAWSEVAFDHGLTDWPLDGKHLETACHLCHFEMKNNIIQNQTFKDLSTECVSCHTNVHEDQFAINGETDCVRCHDTGNWFPEKFDHNATLFPLEGRHAEIECSACHKTLMKNGKTIIEYKIEKFECIDCHS